MASAKATTDHDEIRRWVEERGGFPAHVKRTEGGDDPGVLRIDYPGFSGQQSLERIDWDQWFEWFDRDSLAFLYQPQRNSRFSKLVDRGSVEVSGGRSSSRKASSRKAPARRSASKKRASSKKSSSKKAAAKKASTRRTSAKKASSKKASAKKTSSKKRTASKKAASKKSSVKRSAGSKKAPSRSSSSANRTTDHNVIRRWVEARGGFPARVKRTGSKKDPGILRIDYPGFSGGKTLERIGWKEWFDWFDRDKLAFLFQNKANSRFSKLVRR